MNRPFPRSFVLWTLVSGITLLQTSAQAVIPPAAFMKEPTVAGGSHFVFSSTSPYVLRPPTGGVDAQPVIQKAIDACSAAGGSLGGVIFLASGTYLIKSPIVIHDKGVSIVGLRSNSGTNGWGAYPTITYDNTFNDPDYTNRASITDEDSRPVNTVQYPAAIRINGSKDYKTGATYSGIRGVNIRYVGSGAGHGGLATGLAIYGVNLAVVQDITISSSTSTGPYNGIHAGKCFRFIGRNLKVDNVRGDFGLRAGEWPALGGAGKFHGVQISSTGSTANLVEMRSEGELIGAKLNGGGIGLLISGTGPGDDDGRSANCGLRSVLVENSAKEGVVVDNWHGLWLSDLTIKNPKREGFRVRSGLLGGLQMANLRIENAGLSGIRVSAGLNVNFTNAVVLNSGQQKSGAAAADLPIASVFIDGAVTSMSLTGARLGTSGTGAAQEDWGIYWSTTGSAWHEPTIIASNVNFFPNFSSTTRTNPRGALPTLSIKDVAGYYTLYDIGAFNDLASDSWSILPANTDFSDSTLKHARGYNWYDLDEIRSKQWIDLTKTAVVASGTINQAAFDTLLNDLGPEGAVLYLPSGVFNYSSTNATFTAKSYRIGGSTSGLVINKPNVKILGDGAEVTTIAISGTAANANCPPQASVFRFTGSATGGGLFGLTIDHDGATARPGKIAVPYPDSPEDFREGDTVTGLFPNISYAPSVTVDNTSNIRIAGVSTNNGMGGGFSLINTSNSELYYTNARLYANNGRPNDPMAGYLVSGTTAGKSHDVRLVLAFAGGLSNVLVPSGTFTISGTQHILTDKMYSWNDVDNFVRHENLPNFDTLRIEGDSRRVRIDSATFIHGKNGFKTNSLVVGSSTMAPRNIEAFRYATDHINGQALNLESVIDSDFLSCWLNSNLVALVGPGVTGDFRMANTYLRGGKYEGLSVRGGNNIMLVNNLIGRTCNINALYPPENRPLAGLFIGENASATTGNRTRVIGGTSGWMFYKLSGVTNNGNEQDWGITLGSTFNQSRYWAVGVDLYGNGGPSATSPSPTTPPSQTGYQRGFGVQTSGTSATWITDNSNWP